MLFDNRLVLLNHLEIPQPEEIWKRVLEDNFE